MSDAFNRWLNGVADGEPATLASFARSAIPELPRVTTPVVKLNPARWGFATREEMERAGEGDGE